MQGVKRYKTKNNILALCDFTLSSDQKRFYLIDLKNKKLLINSYVAHGKNSGETTPTNFSNEPESLKSSKGFFQIGNKIMSPKHGIALLLDGLEKNVNDNAKKREIIIHGANYVSSKFISKYGRLGRSFGCPALPSEIMVQVASIVGGGSLLYIHTK
jgi:hypothetical protein